MFKQKTNLSVYISLYYRQVFFFIVSYARLLLVKRVLCVESVVLSKIDEMHLANFVQEYYIKYLEMF